MTGRINSETVRTRTTLCSKRWEEYLSAAPTGSRFLSKQAEFTCARFDTQYHEPDLEERGFIAQHHTSAGRVPHRQRIPVYVDRLMKPPSTFRRSKKPNQRFGCQAEPSDLHLFMEATSTALSRVTHQSASYVAPQMAREYFRRLYIFPSYSHRVLLHLTVDFRFCQTMFCELTTEISPERSKTLPGLQTNGFTA